MTFPSDEHASELRDLFFESAEEILQDMNEAGLALEERPNDKEQLRHVRRAVHTLKGDSAACGFRELSELAHELEDVLTPELAKQNAGPIAEVVLTAADTFHEMLAAYRRQSATARRRSACENTSSSCWTSLPRRHNHAFRSQVRLDRVRAAADRGGVPARRNDLQHRAAPRSRQRRYRPRLSSWRGKPLESAGKILALHPESGARRRAGSIRGGALSSAQSADWIRKRCHVPSVVENIAVEQACRCLQTSCRAICSRFCSSPKRPRFPPASSRRTRGRDPAASRR